MIYSQGLGGLMFRKEKQRRESPGTPVRCLVQQLSGLRLYLFVFFVALLPPPEIRFGNVQSLGRLSDLLEEPGRVARVTGGWLQVRDVTPPEAVELSHEEFAQVLANHRRQGHGE